MKFYFVKTNGCNMVAVADRYGKCYIVDPENTDSGIDTLKDAVNESYEMLYGCKSAKECAYAIGIEPEGHIFKLQEILDGAEDYTEFVPREIQKH